MPSKRAVACRRRDFIADCCGPDALVHRGGGCRRVRLSARQAYSDIPSPKFVVWCPAPSGFGGGCGRLRRPALCGRQRGVVDECDPLVVSLYGYSGHLGGRPFADA